MKKQLTLLLAGLLNLSCGIAQFTNSDLQNSYWIFKDRLKMGSTNRSSESVQEHILDNHVYLNRIADPNKNTNGIKAVVSEENPTISHYHRKWMSTSLCFNHVFYTSKYGIANSNRSPLIAAVGFNFLTSMKLNSPFATFNIIGGLFEKNYSISNELRGKSIFYEYGLNGQFHFPIAKEQKSRLFMLGASCGISRNVILSKLSNEEEFYRQKHLTVHSAFSVLLRKYLKNGKSLNLQYCFKLSPLFIKSRTILIGPPYTVAVSYQI